MVTYSRVVRASVDRAGNLRLYRRGRFLLLRQDVYHPAGEWASVTLEGGLASVQFSDQRKGRAA